jgi:hypothetical protein
MSARSRLGTLTAAVLAALAVVCALALRSPEPGVAAEAPAGMSVTASLDSCSSSVDGPRCQFSVSFSPLDDARSYAVTISSPGGAELLTTAAQPSGGTFSVPYSGDGTYGVRIVAYGP